MQTGMEYEQHTGGWSAVGRVTQQSKARSVRSYQQSDDNFKMKPPPPLYPVLGEEQKVLMTTAPST